MLKLSVVLSLCAVGLGCAGKSGGGGGGSAASGGGGGGGGGSVVTTLPIIQFTGTPANPSTNTSLAVGVMSGSGGATAEYQYALLTGSKATCTGATYSAFRTIGTKITDNLGADGTYLLCGLGKNAVGTQKTPTTYTWVKDTTGPVVSMNLTGGFGPNSTGGGNVVFSGNVSDTGSGVGSVTLSIQLGSGGCLNKTLNGFDATCPNPLPLTGAPTWSLGAIADDIFSTGSTYNFILTGLDKLKNSTVVKASMPYLSVAPAAPLSLTVTPGVGRLELAWSAVSGAAGYVVVRRQSSAVDTGPTAGKAYTSGATISSLDTVAYAGTAVTLTDAGLAGDQSYYYAVYAYDLAYNYSPAVTGSETVKVGFTGLNQVFVAGPNRLIGASWQLVSDGVDALSSYTYNLFQATTSGAETFTSPSAAFTGSATFGTLTGSTSATPLYLVGRSVDPSGNSSTNTGEKTLNFASGYHHRIVGMRTFNGEPSSTATTASPIGVAIDVWGNQLFTANTQDVYVRCHETVNAPYCRGRQFDSIYTLFGSDYKADSADASPPYAPLGATGAIAVDPFGNVYVTDLTYFRIKVLCNNTGSAAGFCAGKSDGMVYRLIGTGATGSTTSGAAASSSSVGTLGGIALDAYGNIFYGDQTSFEVMAICQAAAGPFCTGKTVGDVYLIAGIGTYGDGGSGVVAASTYIGAPAGVAVDSYGNVFFADNYARVRAVCETTSGLYCSGRLVGYLYQVAGDGTTSDGASGGVAASTAVGYPTGVALDPNGNIFVGDYDNEHIRVICLSVNTGGYCAGLTAGDMYVVAGNGAYTDPAAGSAIAQGLGQPEYMAADAFGNIFMADGNWGRVRMICENTQGGDCVGRVVGDIYPLIGAYSSSNYSTISKPALFSAPNLVTGLANDSAGNLYYTDENNAQVYAVCMNVTTSGTFCTGKTAGNRYVVAGTGGYTTGGTDVSFANFGLSGLSGGVAIDPYNNVFVASGYGEARIRAFCINTSGGYCSGQTAGNTYVVAGDGSTAGGGASGTTATSQSSGVAEALTADSYGNLFWFDQTSFRVYVVCNVTTSSTTNVCSSKTAGYEYIVAGSGSQADGANAAAAVGAGMGYVYNMAVDAHNNLFVNDSSYYRVRAICLNTSGGYCSSLTSGDVYRVAGTGSVGDGANDTAFASATFEAFTGAAFDKYGNLFVSDYAPRIRVLCFNVAASEGYCSGKTANYVYNFAGGGTSSTGDGGSNLPIASVLINTGYEAQGLAINSSTNDIYYSDTESASIRMFTGY